MVKYLTIGKIVNTHGIKGEFKVFPDTERNDRFKNLMYVYIDKDGVITKFSVDSVRYHKNFVLLKLKGIDDINKAEEYVGSKVKVDRENAIPLEEDEYFICDILGSEVYTEEGQYLGRVRDILKTGSNDVYVVEGLNGKEILLPAISEVIKKVDIQKRKLLVRMIEGLL